MFARDRCYRLPLQGLETLLLLLYLISVPRPSARALPGETNRYGRGLCLHVPTVIAGRCRDWTLFLALCRAKQSTFGMGCNPANPTHTTPMGIVCNYQQTVGGRISTLRWTSLSALAPRSILLRHERGAGCTTVVVESIEYYILQPSH